MSFSWNFQRKIIDALPNSVHVSFPSVYALLVFLLQDISVGDVSARMKLKDSLHCKSFQWFLDNVFPEKLITDKSVYAYGMVSQYCPAQSFYSIVPAVSL